MFRTMDDFLVMRFVLQTLNSIELHCYLSQHITKWCGFWNYTSVGFLGYALITLVCVSILFCYVFEVTPA